MRAFKFAIAETQQILPSASVKGPQTISVDWRRRLAQMHIFCQNAFRGPRDQTRRLGGPLAAQMAVLGRSWVGLAPCKKRRSMETTLGQQEHLEHIAARVREQSQPIS